LRLLAAVRVLCPAVLGTNDADRESPGSFSAAALILEAEKLLALIQSLVSE